MTPGLWRMGFVRRGLSLAVSRQPWLPPSAAAPSGAAHSSVSIATDQWLQPGVASAVGLRLGHAWSLSRGESPEASSSGRRRPAPVSRARSWASAAAQPAEETAEPGQGSQAALRLPVRTLSGAAVGTHDLPGSVFNVPLRLDLLHRAVRWQASRARQGTAVTKDRSAVRGGGRKPRPQKGSGRARMGTIRAPQNRGGGVVHGPVLRDHALDLPRKVRRAALKVALSAKAAEGRLLLVDAVALDSCQTRRMDEALRALLAGFPRRSVVLSEVDFEGPVTRGKKKQRVPEEGEGGAQDSEASNDANSSNDANTLTSTPKPTSSSSPANARLAASNLPWVECLPSKGLTVLSILKRDVLVLSTASADSLAERLSRPLSRGIHRRRAAL